MAQVSDPSVPVLHDPAHSWKRYGRLVRILADFFGVMTV